MKKSFVLSDFNLGERWTLTFDGLPPHAVIVTAISEEYKFVQLIEIPELGRKSADVYYYTIDSTRQSFSLRKLEE